MAGAAAESRPEQLASRVSLRSSSARTRPYPANPNVKVELAVVELLVVELEVVALMDDDSAAEAKSTPRKVRATSATRRRLIGTPDESFPTT